MVSRTSCTTSAYTAVAGPVAVTIGSTLAFIVADQSGVVRWLLAVLVSLAWAGVRLAVVLLVNRDADGAGRATLRAAWGATLLPFALAVTPPLLAGAWVISLLLMMYSLERAGYARGSAGRTVLWVAGFELATAAAVWVLGSLSFLTALG